MIKKFSLSLMIILYIGAGINHFINPDAYYPIIPPWLPNHPLINIVSGILEITFGAMLIIKKTRWLGAMGILVLLILFIPAHVYMIQKGGCMSEQMCVPVWVAWVRLFPLQFVLMFWAWKNRH